MMHIPISEDTVRIVQSGDHEAMLYNVASVDGPKQFVAFKHGKQAEPRYFVALSDIEDMVKKLKKLKAPSQVLTFYQGRAQVIEPVVERELASVG